MRLLSYDGIWVKANLYRWLAITPCHLVELVDVAVVVSESIGAAGGNMVKSVG